MIFAPDNARHMYSALSDQRERPVPCSCCRRETWNVCALCDRHCEHDVPAVAVRPS